MQAQREQITEADGFRLYSRSLELRFRLHKNIFGENNSRVKLKCVAHIREVPKAIKESVATIHVPSMDELTNQKLITWRSAGKINKRNLHNSRIGMFLNFFLLLAATFFSLFVPRENEKQKIRKSCNVVVNQNNIILFLLLRSEQFFQIFFLRFFILNKNAVFYFILLRATFVEASRMIINKMDIK